MGISYHTMTDSRIVWWEIFFPSKIENTAQQNRALLLSDIESSKPRVTPCCPVNTEDVAARRKKGKPLMWLKEF
jgi:hypothetical protein